MPGSGIPLSAVASIGYLKVIWCWSACVFLSAEPLASNKRIFWGERLKSFRAKLLIATLLALSALLAFFALAETEFQPLGRRDISVAGVREAFYFFGCAASILGLAFMWFERKKGVDR